MKATYNQIEKALKNTFIFGVDGTEDLYNAIRNAENDAFKKIIIHKSSDHYTKSDWKKVYLEIKKIIA